MSQPDLDIIIAGGGIVGLATALALVPRFTVAVLEAEADLAGHQTGHNSGVIHSGLYYKPGSLKARNCAAGREAMFRFCAEHGIAHERCGKLVIATRERELPALAELERRGAANGLEGIKRLSAKEIREFEPHAQGLAGLWVPQTGIVDYRQVSQAMAERIRDAGGEIHTGARVQSVRQRSSGLVLDTPRGAYACTFLVNCAGYGSDRLARKCGATPELQILPFRGEYYDVIAERRHLVKNLIYPVPDPRFPFLGVHFTRTIHGELEAGPNAVLALSRTGYRWREVAPRDILELLTYPGFWRLALRYWRTGMMEVVRSLSKRRFVAALQELVPEIRPSDVVRAGAGVRAQAVDRAGRTLDDFCLAESERALHVLNAPSPGATASLSIGESIAARVVERLATDQ